MTRPKPCGLTLRMPAKHPEKRASFAKKQAQNRCHLVIFLFWTRILDCINDGSRSFYLKWDFQALPGSPYRLYLSVKQLEAMIQGPC